MSRNALYSLARKDSVLPESVLRIARALGVQPSSLLEETVSPEQDIHRIMETVNRIAARHPGIDRDNVRHTLILLRERPITRLRRALRRGRNIDFQQ